VRTSSLDRSMSYAIPHETADVLALTESVYSGFRPRPCASISRLSVAIRYRLPNLVPFATQLQIGLRR
jgi:hypothetical protein